MPLGRGLQNFRPVGTTSASGIRAAKASTSATNASACASAAPVKRSSSCQGGRELVADETDARIRAKRSSRSAGRAVPSRISFASAEHAP